MLNYLSLPSVLGVMRLCSAQSCFPSGTQRGFVWGCWHSSMVLGKGWHIAMLAEGLQDLKGAADVHWGLCLRQHLTCLGP